MPDNHGAACNWYHLNKWPDSARDEAASCRVRREEHPETIPITGDLTMTTSNVEYPRVVSRAEWLAARKEFLIKEKELTRLRDQLNAERRRLPMVKIEKDYVFMGPDGNVHLLRLF
jgi:hypothetical protein